jgi:catechol 2,3-dioxygenase-like lactoylglutathione lyase family enzyme
VTAIGLAHTGICVRDIDEAVGWYRDVLGMKVLSPPYTMSGDAIERDMGELLPGLSLGAAIVGFERSDHVIELLEYPGSTRRDEAHDKARDAISDSKRDLTRRIDDLGISHVGIVCEDIAATRLELERKGVRFLTSGIAGVAGLRTTWFEDPYGNVFILVEKGDAGRPYWRQPVPTGES